LLPIAPQILTAAPHSSPANFPLYANPRQPGYALFPPVVSQFPVTGYTCLMRSADLSDDDPLEFYLCELATVQPLISRERADLLKQIQSGNNQAEQAEKHLIEANLSMVVVIAERFSSQGCPMLDLIQAGNGGLLFAVESFTRESGDNFSAYAASCIESALSKAVSESKSQSE
jgi:DNA-directed RNA polymerase sigma subunit (sigma70/sigma32)